MKYVNRKPTIFFVSIATIFSVASSFLFVFLGLNYFRSSSEIIAGQRNDFLLIESVENLSFNWNKTFLLMDQVLLDENYNIASGQENAYLEQSQYDLETLKKYYFASNKDYSQNLNLAGILLNIGRELDSLNSYSATFYDYVKDGDLDRANSLRHQEITQLENVLNDQIGLFVDDVRKQNDSASQGAITKQKVGIRWFVAVFLLYLFIFPLFPLFVYRMVRRYFNNFREVIYKINSGDLSQRLKEKTGPLEFCELSKSFNRMIHAMQNSRNFLEAKAAEKTIRLAEQLAKTNEQTVFLEEQKEDMDRTKSSILNILDDINEEREHSDSLAQDLQKFKLAVDHASDYIIITDNNGIIIYANAGVKNIVGFDPEEIMGKKVGSKDLWGGNMPLDFYQKLWDTVKVKKQNFTAEFNDHRKNGDKFVAEVSISPVLDENNEVEFFVSIGRDITTAKKIDLAKTEFVSLASHQLRTPLTAVKWHTEMLLDGDAGPLGDAQKEFTREIYDSNERMIDLVDSLLDVSRLDLGTLKVEGVPTDILKLVKDLVIEVGPLIAKKKVKLIEKYDSKLPIIDLDKKLSFMIIQNLLTNAVKYSNVGGQVVIEISSVDKDHILIKVADNGYGIPFEDQGRIAVKLFRASNARKNETDGNGLGLYMVKSIVDQAGGKFWFESKEGKGSTFYVSLPVKLSKK